MTENRCKIGKMTEFLIKNTKTSHLEGKGLPKKRIGPNMSTSKKTALEQKQGTKKPSREMPFFEPKKCVLDSSMSIDGRKSDSITLCFLLVKHFNCIILKPIS